MFLLVVLLVFANVALSLPASAAPPSELPTLSQCKELIESAIPTIVQFSYDGWRHGCGVIVSPEGHVVVNGPVAAVLDNRLLELRLSDGRQVTGEALGWSSEFKFGVLKITEPGKWPVVKLSEQIRAGEVCLALGYPSNHDGKNHRPENRLALVTRVSTDVWFTSSHRSEFSAHPVFNMHGELLGLGVYGYGPPHNDTIHNSASVIKNHWKELAEGRNLDRKRLLDEIRPPEKFGKAAGKMSDETLAKIKAAIVQTGKAGEKPTGSGVIIPDGYVITCAHHRRLPGATVMVTIADGRTAKAAMLGTNWLTDVSVLKITDEGEWPFVNLGYSQLLAPESPVVVIGYPMTNNQKPLVLGSRLIERPTGNLKRRDNWSDSMYCACDDKEIFNNLGGASGGGVFDTSGNVIGVLLGRAGEEIHIARVELFHKNWAELVATNTVQEIDSALLKRLSPGLTKLTSDLTNRDPKH
jgi:S1-C subfamily serine protease